LPVIRIDQWPSTGTLISPSLMVSGAGRISGSDDPLIARA